MQRKYHPTLGRNVQFTLHCVNLLVDMKQCKVDTPTTGWSRLLNGEPGAFFLPCQRPQIFHTI